MARDAVEGHVWFSGPDEVDVQGLCYRLATCRYSWPVPRPESMLMSMGCAVTGNHADVSGLGCHLGPL